MKVLPENEDTLQTKNPGEEPVNTGSLSYTELLSLVNEQKKEIDRLNKILNPPPTDWHSLFYALLHIVLFGYKDVEINREVVLGSQPSRADFVVVSDRSGVDLGLSIFQSFKKWNIIEFKNPSDELSESVIWKVIGYAALFIAKYKVPNDEVTLTLVRGAKPVKLFKTMGRYISDGGSKGIYRIKDWKVDLPIQIIVTSELQGEEYALFRAVSKHPQLEDIQKVIHDGSCIKDEHLIDWYRDYLDIMSKIDREIVDQARRNDAMTYAWMDIFKPEIDEKINAAVAEEHKRTVTNMLFEYVQDGDMPLNNAAKRAGVSPENFLSEMEKRGYRVPEMA